VLNLPVIADTLAVRAVIYNDQRGGYIDNVPGTFTRKSTDLGIYYANYPTGCAKTNSCQVPPGSAAATTTPGAEQLQSGHLPGYPCLRPVPDQ